MATETYQAAGTEGLTLQPLQITSKIERQARKAQAARLQKGRRRRQTFLGVGFLILLAG